MHDEHLATVFETIADTLLGVPAERVLTIAGHPFAADSLVAEVRYTGSFHGALSATFSATLARELAARMMGRPVGTCSEEDVRDAVGEIVNIAAGNIRGLISSQCQLSLPTVCVLAPATTSLGGVSLAHTELVLLGQPLLAELRSERA